MKKPLHHPDNGPIQFVFMHTMEFHDVYRIHQEQKRLGIPPTNQLARYRAALMLACAWYRVHGPKAVK